MAAISIIIPVYNVEKYINECIDSVIKQSLTDIEIILVDDSSPDRCPIICDEYATKDKRVKVIHKKNEGFGIGRNYGIDIATGEYLAFIDSDDYIDTCTFEHLYRLAKNNNLDAIYYRFDRDTNSGIQRGTPVEEITVYEKESKEELMLDIIAADSTTVNKVKCSSCCALYRSSIMKSNNIKFHSEREIISEDLIFNLDFLSHSTRVALNEGHHYHYRINLSSTTRKIREDKVIKNLQLYKYIEENIKSWNIDSLKAEKRNAILFIGNNRTAIQQYMSSSLPYSNKKAWLKEQLSIPLWQTLYQTLNWKELPKYPKIFFYLCAKKKIFALYLISVFRNKLLALAGKSNSHQT